MEKLEVLKVEGNNYTLKNEKDNKTYNFVLTFFDVDGGVVVGDVISVHQELLDPKYEEYSTEYYFGPVDQVYGRAVKGAEDKDVIAITKGRKTIVLKRFFG